MFKDIFGNIVQNENLSLYRISKDTGIPKTIIYDWASGGREPVSEYVIKLADYLNVSIDYLVGRTDKKEVNK